MRYRPYLPPDRSHPHGGRRGATAATKEHGSGPRARDTYAASPSGVRFSSRGLARDCSRPTKSPYFAHGELTKRIFDAMRTHGTVTSAEIAAVAMRDKGLDPDTDPVTRTDFVRRVGLP